MTSYTASPNRKPRSSGEMRASRSSERQGRLIDSDEAASMEKKKREGYF